MFNTIHSGLQHDVGEMFTQHMYINVTSRDYVSLSLFWLKLYHAAEFKQLSSLLSYGPVDDPKYSPLPLKLKIFERFYSFFII